MMLQAFTALVLLSSFCHQALTLPAGQPNTVSAFDTMVEGSNPDILPRDLDAGHLVNLPRSASTNGTSSNNGTNASAGTYTVVSGDTLDTIAANEGTTTQQLEDVNPGVMPTDLQIGEVLNLPSSGSSNGTSST